MAFKSGSYQQLTTIPTSPHDDLYMFLDSSQNGVFDSDTGITSSTTAPTRINRGLIFRYSDPALLAMGQDRLVVMQSDRPFGTDSDYLFHIYNLNYFNNLTDSGIINVSSDSSLSEFSASIQNGSPSDYGSLTQIICEGSSTGHNIANDRIVHSGNWEGRGQGVAGIYDLKGQLIKFLYKDDTSDTKTNGHFGISSDVGSGRIVVSDLYYLDNAGDSIGAAFLYDLNGNFINTMRPPKYANIDSDNEGEISKGYYKPRERFGENVTISGPNILVSQHYANGTNSAQAGVVHIYDLGGTYKKTIKSTKTSSSFGLSMHAKDGIIVVESFATGLGPQLEVFDGDGQFIGCTRDNANAFHRDYTNPIISDGKIFSYQTDTISGEVWKSVSVLKRDAGASTGKCEIEYIEPPADLQSSWTSSMGWGFGLAADNGWLAISSETNGNTSGLDDSFNGVYLYEFPKQKNLTNLLDDF